MGDENMGLDQPNLSAGRAKVLISKASCPEDVLLGLTDLSRDGIHDNILLMDDIVEPLKNVQFGNCWQLCFCPSESQKPSNYHMSCSYFADTQTTKIDISYFRKIEAFRALGYILTLIDDGFEIDADNQDSLIRSETAQFETAGLMMDCSRNGVPLPSTVQSFLRKMALMGLNMLQLYTEDTYEVSHVNAFISRILTPDIKVEGEPFFGYLRGGYTQKELQELDEYASHFGIEMIPCIQTLGHLGQILQWPCYHHLRDTHDVLLANAAETYALLQKMIIAAARPFRSKRIHIGMDEAHGIGEGRYKQFFGSRDGTDIFTDHLKQVNSICINLGLQPMIWSDMLFCLKAQNNSLQGYYDSANPATPELISSIPANIELVYWDYYHTSEQFYTTKIHQHWQLAEKAPWVAGGIWTWNRFWASLPFTFNTTRACMQASKNSSLCVRNTMITIWGDEGNECDVFSALPALLYYAEHCYSAHSEVDIPLLKKKFRTICAANFDAWIHASRLDDISAESLPMDMRTHFTSNMSKWLLWEDPFYSFMSPQYQDINLEQHYGQLSLYLWKAIAERANVLQLNNRIELAAILATCLSLKCHLRERLTEAYMARDWSSLRTLVDTRVILLLEEIDRLWQFHRRMWMSTYKPFGWETLELRYGGLRARMATMHWRLTDYLQKVEAGHDVRLPELESHLEVVYPGASLNIILDYHRVSKPCL